MSAKVQADKDLSYNELVWISAKRSGGEVTDIFA